MAATFLEGLSPWPPEIDPAPFLIESERIILRQLTELDQMACPLAVFRVGSDAPSFSAKLVLRGDETTIEPLAASDREQAATQEGPYLVVALPGPVRVQFHLPQLSAPLPREIWRIQRRDAFRVQPPARDHAELVCRGANGHDLRFPLIDLSVTGLAVAVLPGHAVPEAGLVWEHARVEAVGQGAIPCSVEVVRSSTPRAGQQAERVLSCHFALLSPEAERRIQLYVTDVERRIRAVERA